MNLNAWKIESVGEGGGGGTGREDGPPLREPEMGTGSMDEEPPF